MDVGFGSPAFLLLTGGFAVSAWNAVVRRDGPSTIAMGIASVCTAHLAGLPGWLLSWGWTVVIVATAMSLAAVLLHRLTGSDAYRLGLAGAMAMVAILVAHHRHQLPSVPGALGDRALALGTQLHRQVEMLAHDHGRPISTDS